MAPFVVLPQTYQIPPFPGHWCSLREVCEIIPDLSRIIGASFTPTPEDLISRFAALASFNRSVDADGKRKKIFRYCENGQRFWGVEVPTTHPRPPYIPFKLPVIPEFVSKDWVEITLKAIYLGAITAVDLDGLKIGLPPASSKLNSIRLEGEEHLSPILIKLPDCCTL